MPVDGHPTDCTLTNADNIYIGTARSPYYRDGKRGIRQTHTYLHNAGAIATKIDTGIMSATLVTTVAGLANMLTTLATGSLVAAAVATFDVCRAPSITATGDVSATPLTFTGLDELGRTTVSKIVGPTGTTVVNGPVGFKSISKISATAAFTLAISIGSANVFPFPFRLKDKGAVASVSQDGKPESTLTLVAGLAVATVPTATTGDTRGTWAPNTAPDGTKAWALLFHVDHTDDALAFGTAPFAG